MASGSFIQHWLVTSEFQYRPWGPVIYFLNNQLHQAVVEAFRQALTGRQKRSPGPRNNVNFHPISRRDVHDEMACESLCFGESTGQLGEGEASD
jgi:hypothetical protein